MRVAVLGWMGRKESNCKVLLVGVSFGRRFLVPVKKTGRKVSCRRFFGRGEGCFLFCFPPGWLDLCELFDVSDKLSHHWSPSALWLVGRSVGHL